MLSTKNLHATISLCLLLFSCQSPQQNPNSVSAETKNEKDTTQVIAITSFEDWFQNPQPLISAHRGGPYPGFPENAIETFENIRNHIPAIIECDVSMSKDSILVLMHDKTLDRTTTGQGNITDLTYEELKKLQLIDNNGNVTSYQIPTLEEVLVWGKENMLFTLDVKRGVPFEMVMEMVKRFDATSFAAIITYRIEDAKLVHSLNPQAIISVSAGSEEALNQIILSEIPGKNLLGFVGTREPEKSHYQKVADLGIKTILGTLGNLDKSAEAKGNDDIYLTYVENGAHIIATDRPLEVAKVLNRDE